MSATVTASISSPFALPVVVHVVDDNCPPLSTDAVFSMMAAEIATDEVPMPSRLRISCNAPLTTIVVERQSQVLKTRQVKLRGGQSLANSRELALLAAEALNSAWQEAAVRPAPPPPPTPVIAVKPIPAAEEPDNWSVAAGAASVFVRQGGAAWGPFAALQYRRRFWFARLEGHAVFGQNQGQLGRASHRSLGGAAVTGVHHQVGALRFSGGLGFRLSRTAVAGETDGDGVSVTQIALTHGGPFASASMTWVLSKRFGLVVQAELGVAALRARADEDDQAIWQNSGAWQGVRAGPCVVF